MKKENTSLSKPKKGWFKHLFKVCATIIVLLIVLIIVIYMTLGTIVKRAITTAVPPITGTAVNVDNVDISLLKGHIAFTGFNIANPKGFTHPDIFSLGSIVIDFDPKSVLTDKIIINQVAINKTMADAEINQQGQVNIMILQNNIQNYMEPAKSATKTESQKTPKSENGKKVIIQKLTIDNTELKLGAMGQTIQINLPRIEKMGIGEGQQKKNTIPETVALILSYFSEASIQGISNSGNQLFMQGLKNTQAMINQSKEMLNQQLGQVKQTSEDLKQAGDNIKKMGDDVKNIGSNLDDTVKGLGGMFKN